MIRFARFLLGLVFATAAIVTIAMWFDSSPYYILLTMLFTALALWAMGYESGIARLYKRNLEIPQHIQTQLLAARKEFEKSPEFLEQYRKIEREARVAAERMEKELSANSSYQEIAPKLSIEPAEPTRLHSEQESVNRST